MTTRHGRALDLTATEARLLETLARQPGRVFTRAALLDAVRGVEGDAYERAIDSHIKNLRRKIEVDPVRIREALANLVANAVNASPPQSVVTIRVAPRGDRIAIDVVDRGRGIASDRLPRIFDRFYKDPSSRGSGLGLSIARSLIEAHGGTISAQSSESQGTTMTVMLPCG